jgi:hypothetical protein
MGIASIFRVLWSLVHPLLGGLSCKIAFKAHLLELYFCNWKKTLDEASVIFYVFLDEFAGMLFLLETLGSFLWLKS